MKTDEEHSPFKQPDILLFSIRSCLVIDKASISFHWSGTICSLECTGLFTGVKGTVHWSGTKEMAVG
ncbi:hypothetical protein [Bacteroides ovatus]|uniref:hypothetical protein n=1 Tax=Bacteroides ovatus TaxID=28116 RepID=UPI0011141110|nr:MULTISPECIES: hypothetical protein [Bacteroides]